LWRIRSQGTRSEKGNRWVERVLSVRHTCRIRGRPTFPILVDVVSGLFTGERPDLRWITQHEPLPVLPTPVIRYRSTYRMVLNKADYSTRGIYPLCPNLGKGLQLFHSTMLLLLIRRVLLTKRAITLWLPPRPHSHWATCPAWGG
jgi:hypothetical protein